MPASVHSRRARLASLTLLASLYGAAAQAEPDIGTYGNILIESPYADAAGEQFGRGLVSGDFNDDNIEDLAIAENGSTRVRILLGVPSAVSDNPLTIRFIASTITTLSHNYEMAAGDFDGDGADELALGAANTSTGGMPSAGAVFVYDRASNGTWSLQEEIRAGTGYPGSPEVSARLGYSLAVGDFDGDDFEDLAIGIVGQTVGGVDDAGAVMVTYGSLFGITGSGAQLFNRTNDGLTFTPRADDSYGHDVATRDFDGDGADDLAIGVPQALCPNGTDEGGAVVVMYGVETDGLDGERSRIFRPGIQGVAGDCAPGGRFGNTLAGASFDGGGLSGASGDLAIGAPNTNNGNGAVYVLYGTDTGLSAAGSQRILAPALPGGDSTDGRFGSTIAAGTLRESCVFIFCRGNSLAIGAPFATVDGVDNAGVVWIVDPAEPEEPLDPSTLRPIAPRAPLDFGAPHTNDQFGNALAIGDFNDDGLRDLAIGAYLYDDGPAADAGAVQVLYQFDQVVFADGFE